MPRKKASHKRRIIKPSQLSIHSPHKRVLLHPYFIFVLLCLGVFLCLWTYRVNATDVKVTARVAGLPPAVPAQILSPAEGQRFSSAPIILSGTCPTPSYVKIASNDIDLGYALCSNSGNFTLALSLLPDANELIAHVYNLADEEGPLSSPVKVYYDILLSPPPSAQTPLPDVPASSRVPQTVRPPLLVGTEFSVRAFYTGDEVKWQLSMSGGTPPYAINIDWGDGTNSVYSKNSASDFDISHIYTKPGPSNGAYIVKASASDGSSGQSSLQFFVFVVQKQTATTNTSNGGTIATEQSSLLSTILKNKFLATAWPSFMVICLMCTSFWLGEKEVSWRLRRKPRSR